MGPCPAGPGIYLTQEAAYSDHRFTHRGGTWAVDEGNEPCGRADAAPDARRPEGRHQMLVVRLGLPRLGAPRDVGELPLRPGTADLGTGLVKLKHRPLDPTYTWSIATTCYCVRTVDEARAYAAYLVTYQNGDGGEAAVRL